MAQGAYPSTSTWYVAAGDFPTGNSSSRADAILTHRTQLLKRDGTLTMPLPGAAAPGSASVNDPSTNGYAAQISKVNENICSSVRESWCGCFGLFFVY